VETQVVGVEGFGFGEVAAGMSNVAQTVVTEGKEVEAVDAVALVEAVVPDEQVGERDGEIVHRDVVEEMLLAVADEAVEKGARLVLVA
jgi:hypothetical protein